MIQRQEQFKEEITFWQRELSLTGQFPESIRRRLHEDSRHLEYPAWIDPFLVPLRERFPGQRLKALDVGSGPLSTLAWAHDADVLAVHAADPMADEYNRMLRNHCIDFPCPPVNVACEQLTTRYAPETFHFVYSQNALDHAENIQKCFEQVEAVLKPGGLFLLLCHEHEGMRENYQGLHQHNFFAKRGMLCCTNRQGASCLDLRKLRMKITFLDPRESKAYEEGVNTLIYSAFIKPSKFVDRVKAALWKMKMFRSKATTIPSTST